jgi:PD-(D/E)XK nuclease superfamily
VSDLFVLPPAPEVWTPEPEPVAGWLDGYITHFSASSLRMLKVCPEQYRQRYILGRKERPSERWTLGTAVHSAIGHSHRQKIETHEDLPVPEVIEFFHDAAWPEAVEKDGGENEIEWGGFKPDDVRRDGERVTAAYHTVVSPRVQPLAVEQKIEFVVPGVPVPFLGYIDVEEERNNVDLKTGKQVQRKPDANWRTQGTIYAAFKNKPTHFHSVSRAQTPSIATPRESDEMIVQPDEMQRQYIEKVLRDYAAQVEWYYNRFGADEPWPTTGVLMDYKGGPVCNYCGFRKWCVAWAHERRVA